MLDLYVPKILIVRTNHITEVRTQGKEVNEYTREFAWLGDKTIETVVQSVVHRLTLKEHSVIHCYHEGVPVYILGSLEYYYDKLSFIVISTLKSTRSYLPYKLVDLTNRFTFDRDLSTFNEIYDKDMYYSKIELVKKTYHSKKQAALPIEERVKIAMRNLEKTVERRLKSEKRNIPLKHLELMEQHREAKKAKKREARKLSKIKKRKYRALMEEQQAKKELA